MTRQTWIIIGCIAVVWLLGMWLTKTIFKMLLKKNDRIHIPISLS